MASDVVSLFSSLWFPVFFIHRLNSFEVLSILTFFFNGTSHLSFHAGLSCNIFSGYFPHTSCNPSGLCGVFYQHGCLFFPSGSLSISIPPPKCMALKARGSDRLFQGQVPPAGLPFGRYGPSVALRGHQNQHHFETHQNA